MYSEIRIPKTALCLLGVLSAVGYAVLLWLSWRFAEDVPGSDQPTLWMLLLFGLEFIAYWGALTLAVRSPPSRRLLGVIIGGACLFRMILLPSVPIHEIDIYRYIWDGAVFAEGVSPYRYPPRQVLEASQFPAGVSENDLSRLIELQSSNKSLAYSLRRIHFGELATPYPLVSQAVFAVSAMATPSGVSNHVRMVIMKLVLVLFDIATLLVVVGLLKDTGLHLGWSLAYGWCPLMLKEIANGGHLDSIAIFFTTLAVWLLVKGCLVIKQQSTTGILTASALCGSVLGLAIGAKLYPVILLPLFTALWWRRCGGFATVAGLLMSGIVTLGALYPLLLSKSSPHSDVAETAQLLVAPNLNVPDGPVASDQQTLNLPAPPVPSSPSAGLREFLKRWEMNDLIFMVVLENLRPQEEVDPQSRPWFILVPDAWTQALADSSFLLARVLTGGVFGLIACLLAWRAAGKEDPQAWCRAAMLTLAWFWLTCPTQNPWYWCWVVPLLPFARYRTWHVVGACTLLYYLRFWFSIHFPEPPVLGTPYNGEYFFYFVVTWVEFAPCLLALGFEWILARQRKPSHSSDG